MTAFTSRRIDAHSYLILDEDGAQVAITDAAHVALLVAAPDLLAACEVAACWVAGYTDKETPLRAEAKMIILDAIFVATEERP